ncbi:hypothetical protein BDK51DRAFT_32147, partial [Blyttiomyces helicus]
SDRLEASIASRRVSHAEDILVALEEVNLQVQAVARFAELNRTGFRKILKKVDKKLEKNFSATIWNSKINPLPFASENALEDLLERVAVLRLRVTSGRAEPMNGAVLPAGEVVSSCPSTISKGIIAALQGDNAETLSAVLKEANDGDKEAYAALLCETLVKAADHHALACIILLLTLNASVDIAPPTFLDQRNVIHRLTLAAAALPHSSVSRSGSREPATAFKASLDDPTLLAHVLAHAPPEAVHRAALARDFLGRRPLHHAAIHGLAAVARALLLIAPMLPSTSRSEWLDDDGRSPLFHAVSRGQAAVVAAIHNAGWDAVDDVGDSDGDCDTALAVACRGGHAAVVEVLLIRGANPNAKNVDGETPLHLCARNGDVKSVRLLLGLESYQVEKPIIADVEAKDVEFGRTPIFVAAIEGRVEVVEALLQVGAHVNSQDKIGLNPHEHSVFRGHRAVSALLLPHIDPYLPTPPPSSLPAASTAAVSRAFGHPTLSITTLIRLTLGTLDLRRAPSCPAVIFYQNRVHAPHAAGSYLLRVSATGGGAIAAPYLFTLPLPPNANDEIFISAARVEEVIVSFDVLGARAPPGVPAIDGRIVVARACALLATAKTSLWREPTPLGGEVQVPLLGAADLVVLGRVAFEFAVATPFVHRNLSGVGGRTWTSERTKVIGHRGMGSNTAAQVEKGKGHLQLGENTLLSFTTAGALGAEYVEFDVQLTKDLVPVLYHDFLTWETGLLVPLSLITLEQFRKLHPEDRPAKETARASNGLRRSRSSASSVSSSESGGGGKWPTKGNAEGSVRDHFATLEEALK